MNSCQPIFGRASCGLFHDIYFEIALARFSISRQR